MADSAWIASTSAVSSLWPAPSVPFYHPFPASGSWQDACPSGTLWHGTYCLHWRRRGPRFHVLCRPVMPSGQVRLGRLVVNVRVDGKCAFGYACVPMYWGLEPAKAAYYSYRTATTPPPEVRCDRKQIKPGGKPAGWRMEQKLERQQEAEQGAELEANGEEDSSTAAATRKRRRRKSRPDEASSSDPTIADTAAPGMAVGSVAGAIGQQQHGEQHQQQQQLIETQMQQEEQDFQHQHGRGWPGAYDEEDAVALAELYFPSEGW